ncbi:MAG TPA: thioredoxin-disulfide reductase [Spirochaetota bacterium]|nr:thioredoxin-disulfide reductase [Spirochaetota bacterium]HPC42474.1 thioredoxin-disulfide reductase [Spirochaetota bacterium]HPL15069.1 thioredoxin-disulfide reductase [Spirochaetota bacterium]HQF08076.1 thioredoxin-disulfide reductase [Spirochaetota bacterium]HQH97037.1 thioredoxin-disulfide reductase [Spirochaetota bacterium]
MKDLIIIGAGPGGLTAAIYGIRSGLDLTVVEKLSPGGQVMNTYEVENYPGFEEPIAGWDLMSRMEAQARRLGTEIVSGDVASVARDAATGTFMVKMSDNTVMESRTVIAASGASYRRLGVPGEEQYIGHGVSFCATCDGAFYKDRICAVVGGGDTALEEAHFLTRFARKVYLIHRRDKFRGVKVLQDRVMASDKIELVLDSVVESINGTTKVEGVSIKNVKTGVQSSLAVDGFFIFIGFNANTGYLPAEVLDGNRDVMTDINMRTAVPGLFAAGDLRSGSKRQIVMAAAEGATAALEAYDYILGLT